MGDFPSGDLPPLPSDPSAPQTQTPSRRYRIMRLAGYFFGSLILCFLVVHYGRVFGPKAWGSLRLVNTVVNLTPTLLSILFAFVVDKDLADRMRWRWLFRFSVISIGAGLSLLLWHQQALSDIQSSKQINDAVTQAVTDANKHSDTQFQAVQQNVGGVDKKVSEVGNSLNQTATALSSDIQNTSDAIQKTSDRLDASIGKVGKPDPIPPPKIVFTLTDTPAVSAQPSRSETIKPNDDGTYSFKFNVTNSSEVNAEEVEMWMMICNVCEFVGEPKGSDHPPGEEATMRHFVLGSMHAGVSHGEISVSFKVKNPTTELPYFGVSFAYACKTCGKPEKEPDYILRVASSSPPI